MFRRSFLVATIILNQKKGQKGQVYFFEKKRALLRELFFLFQITIASFFNRIGRVSAADFIRDLSP